MVASGEHSRLAIALAVLLLATLASGVAAGAAGEGDGEALARKIEGKLMAPCCGANTVDIHESSAAVAMRREIRELLAAGKTEAEILAFFVERHGTPILAAPPPSGFNLVPYLLPGVIFLAGAGLVFVLTRRWKRATAAQAERPSGTVAEIEPEYLARLERQLQQFD